MPTKHVLWPEGLRSLLIDAGEDPVVRLIVRTLLAPVRKDLGKLSGQRKWFSRCLCLHRSDLLMNDPTTQTNLPVIKFHVLPLKCQQLTSTKPSSCGEEYQRTVRVPLVPPAVSESLPLLKHQERFPAWQI